MWYSGLWLLGFVAPLLHPVGAENVKLRQGFITAGPDFGLRPRQAFTCDIGFTSCADGEGCCPRGDDCTSRSGIPVCDAACGFGVVHCTYAQLTACCPDPGLTCDLNSPGICTPFTKGPSPPLPTRTIPIEPTGPTFPPPVRPTSATQDIPIATTDAITSTEAVTQTSESPSSAEATTLTADAETDTDTTTKIGGSTSDGITSAATSLPPPPTQSGAATKTVAPAPAAASIMDVGLGAVIVTVVGAVFAVWFL